MLDWQGNKPNNASPVFTPMPYFRQGNLRQNRAIDKSSPLFYFIISVNPDSLIFGNQDKPEGRVSARPTRPCQRAMTILATSDIH